MESARELKPLLLGPPVLKLAVAESVTAGHLQELVAAVSGASQFFEGGITAYTLAQKVRHLSVDRADAESVDCVSEIVAQQMALGAARLFNADVAVATTGFAETPPATRGSAPFAFWALCHRQPGRDVSISGRFDVAGARDRVFAQQTIAEHVLAQLVWYLQSWRQKEPSATGADGAVSHTDV